MDEHIPLEASQLNSGEETAPSTLANYLRFTALRYSANIEWVGGAVAGNWLHEAHGVNRWIAALGVASAVTALEVPQSSYASRHNRQADTVANYSLKSELSAAFSATWQGAGATVEVNDSLGLENAKKRRMVQCALYGAAVSLWVTPIPPFNQGAELGRDALKTAIENPVQSIGLVAASSAAVFGGLKLIKKIRLRRTHTKDPEAIAD